MITPADFLTIPYTPDLTQGGIAYACRSLAHTYDRMGGSHTARLQRIVAGVAVELAFRRQLGVENVPHDVLGATHFTEPDRYDIALGGRRCDLKSYVIKHKKRIRALRRTPQMLLDAHALVPVDQLASDHLSDEDLYIFSFLTALTTHHTEDMTKVVEAGHPAFLLHPMPQQWARPPSWTTLGPLALKSDLDTPIQIELGGQDSQRTFKTEALALPPRQRVVAQQEYYTLNYLHTARQPAGLLGVHSPALDETHLIEPAAWGNIWVYGLEITMVGYMTRGEFRRRAKRLPKGSRVLQYPRTRVNNMALPVSELYPLGDLFIRAKNWAQHHRKR